MARLYRDAYGVPHIRAESVTDLARAQGEVTAGDRTWQLEWLRRRATGTTAELFGAPGLAWDTFARRTFLVDTAQRALAALSDQAHDFVAAYVEGVNAGLAVAARTPELDELGADPQPWPTWMPLAVFHAQHLLFAGLGGALWDRHARDVLGDGPDGAALLSHEGPVSSGSNAWAASGERTSSGLPLIGGDPHRVIEWPGVYLQVRLACEDASDPADDFDVLGFSFAGVPGIQHFGHAVSPAGSVAWAITNAMADYQDVRDEAVPPTPADVVEERVEQIVVRDAEPVGVTCTRTVRGVVVEDAWSLADAATELGDLGFEALLPLLRARSVDDVDRALDAWVAPVNNVVIADASGPAGSVRYRLAGRVPLRDADGAWTGWLTPPRHAVPAGGHVVTANERRGPESDAVGRIFAPPHRARRLHALLEGRCDLTAADFEAFHNDSLLATAPLLTSLVPGTFDDFDARMEADSAPAARFAAWRSALVRRLAAEPVFAPFADPPPEHRHSTLFAPWLDLTSRVALGLESLVTAGAPYGIDLGAHARAALDEVDAGPLAPSWGTTHVVTPVHAFETMGRTPPGQAGAAALPTPAVSGDADCVRCTSSYPGQSDACYRGSVARYVWDLADRQRGGWVVPMGVAGRPDDAHHHDQLTLWAEGRLAPIVTDWEHLTEEQP